MHIRKQTKPSITDMNYTEEEIERLLPLQTLEETIESRQLNVYTLFMAHYRHHRQKEIHDEDSFDIDIEDNMLSGNDSISGKNYKTRNTVMAWFLMDLKTVGESVREL